MFKKALQLARKYPTQAEAILRLFNDSRDSQELRNLLGSCTCTNDLMTCTCPPEYSTPKTLNYSGHTPPSN